MDPTPTPTDATSPGDDAANRDSSSATSTISATSKTTAATNTTTAASRRRGAQLEAKTLWVVGSTLAAAGIGCAAGLLQVQRIAPVGLLPVAVGLAAAMAAERLGTALGLRIGLGWLVAAVAWALLAIVAEVYIGHWDHVRDALNFEQNHPKAAVFTDERSATSPAGLLRYFLSRFEQSPILLTTDAGLTLAASVAWIEYRRRRSAAARTKPPEP